MYTVPVNVSCLTTEEDLQKYDAWLLAQSNASLWQSLERKKYLESIEKTVRIYSLEEGGEIIASALVMIDRTTFGLSTWDIPRGPIFKNEELRIKNEELFLNGIIKDAKKDKCLSIYLSPSFPIPNSKFSIKNSNRHIHCEATRTIDLTLSEEDILKQMKPKGRYNIRVAEKHGITVKESDDIDSFYNLVKETSGRDKFTALPKEKYQSFLEHLPGTFLLLAYEPEKNEPIAGLLGVIWNKVGIYYYGASSYAHRASMAPYALQWKAMQICRQAECTKYDLLGIAPPDAPANHPWSGITNFKEKFGGALVTYPAEKEIVLRPIVNKLLNLKRKLLK